jgi:hypothetical protein
MPANTLIFSVFLAMLKFESGMRQAGGSMAEPMTVAATTGDPPGTALELLLAFTKLA